jgi:hypothetical protein
MPAPEALGLGPRDERLDEASERGAEDRQGQEGPRLAVGGAGEEPASKEGDVLEGGVAVQDLEGEPVDDGDGIQDACAPGVPRGPAGGSDGVGVETPSDVLPQPLDDGIKPSMHRGASLHFGVV